MSDQPEHRTFITDNAASDTPTWTELLPPTLSNIVNTFPDANVSGAMWVFTTTGFYRLDDWMAHGAPNWVKVDAANVPADIKRRMVEDLTSGSSFYDDIDR